MIEDLLDKIVEECERGEQTLDEKMQIWMRGYASGARRLYSDMTKAKLAAATDSLYSGQPKTKL